MIAEPIETVITYWIEFHKNENSEYYATVNYQQDREQGKEMCRTRPINHYRTAMQCAEGVVRRMNSFLGLEPPETIKIHMKI